MNAAKCLLALVSGIGLTATAVRAQSTAVTDFGIRLAPAYAQMLNLTIVPDLSTARYTVGGSGSDLRIDVTRLGHEAHWRSIGDETDLYARVTGGYVRFKSTLEATVPSPGAVATRWTAYGLTGGLAAKRALGHGVTVMAGLDAGAMRLMNDADYTGGATVLRPTFDGPIFNWGIDAWVLTPQVALGWDPEVSGRTINLQGHLAWSRIATYGESRPEHRFTEGAGVWSIRAEHAAPTGSTVLDRPLDWIVFGRHSGFFGPDRGVLGFSSVSEAGIGLQVPIKASSDASQRIRLGASYLFGPNVRGWAATLGMGF